MILKISSKTSLKWSKMTGKMIQNIWKWGVQKLNFWHQNWSKFYQNNFFNDSHWLWYCFDRNWKIWKSIRYTNCQRMRENETYSRSAYMMDCWRWQYLGWTSQAVTGLRLRFRDPEGMIVLAVVKDWDSGSTVTIITRKEKLSFQ